MLFFLIDMLIIALFVAARLGEGEVYPGEHPPSANPPTGAPAATARQVPAPWHDKPSPQRRADSPPLERGQGATRRAGEPASSEITVWTALDEHQLTRLLKHSCS